MKRFLSLFLCAFLCLSMAACGGNDEVENIEGDGKPLGKYEQPVDLSLVRASDASIESEVLSKYPDESLTENRFTKLYRDKLNINVKYKWVAANAEQYKSKLNLAMSIGDLPDTFMVNPTQVAELVEAEQIKDMTAIWETYASPLLKEITLKEGDGVLKAAMHGGKLYGIPQMFSSTDRAQFVWVRMDWLRALIEEFPDLGLSANPKTVADFLKIAGAFKSKSSFLTGKSNVTGMAMQGNLWDSMGGITGFMNMFGAYPNIWLEKDGALESGSVQPEVKQALEVLRGMYARGELPMDFATKTAQSIAEDISSQKAGMVMGEQWLCAYPLINTYLADNTADWRGFELFSNGGVETKSQVSMGTYGWWVVNKSNPRPEAIIKIMNQYVESIWGESAEFDKYYMPSDTSAAVWKLSPVNPEPPTKNLDAYLEIKKAKSDDKLTLLKGEAKSIYSNIEAFHNGTPEMWSWSIGYEPNENSPCVYEAMNTYIENDRILYDMFTGAPTPTMAESLSLMNQKQNEAFTNIINGSKSLDEFDKFVTYWGTLGGTKITEEVNAWYRSVRA